MFASVANMGRCFIRGRTLAYPRILVGAAILVGRIVTPIDAAQRAGWFYWFGYWFCTDSLAILNLEAPHCWRGTARDLCLAQGIPHAPPAAEVAS
jgi:hypothetical protein